jgi:ClpP class serine protease
MVKFIDKAESDPGVHTMLFRVDTPGGSVAGADEVGDKIFNSSKKTVTLYENIGASGGIWVFSASDELYATETTLLGSIGVIVSYVEQEAESGVKRVSIVSRNAENKDCSLNGNCKEKLQSMIDSYEGMFYSRIERNTGFTAEQIKTTFNNGDVIFATEAKKSGFIKDIVTFDSILSSLISGATPSGSAGKANNTHKGADMKDSSIVTMLTALFGGGASAEDPTAQAISALKTELDITSAALEAREKELTEAVQAKDEILTRLREAEANGVSVEVAMKMVQAESSKEASKIAIDSKQSDGVTHQNGGSENSGALLAYAKQIAGGQK